jgi:hypothetical protein
MLSASPRIVVESSSRPWNELRPNSLRHYLHPESLAILVVPPKLHLPQLFSKLQCYRISFLHVKRKIFVLSEPWATATIPPQFSNRSTCCSRFSSPNGRPDRVGRDFLKRIQSRVFISDYALTRRVERRLENHRQLGPRVLLIIKMEEDLQRPVFYDAKLQKANAEK